MAKIAFLGALLLAFCMVSAQADSLRKALEKQSTYDSIRVKTLLNLAYSIQYDTVDEAFSNSNQALEISKAIKWERGIALSYRQIGNIYYIKSDYPKAIEYSQMALKVNEKLKNELLEASLYNNIANVYADMGKKELALEYYQKYLTTAVNIKSSKDEMNALVNIGIIHIENENLGEGIEYFNKGLQLTKETKNVAIEAFVLSNIGIAYKKRADYEKSLLYLQQSVELSEKTDNKNAMATALNETSQVYFLKGNYGQAERYANRGLQLAKSSGSGAWQSDSWQILSMIFEKTKRHEKSLEAYKNYYAFRDSIINTSKNEEIVKLTMRFEQEKNEAIAKDEQDKKKAKAQRIENLQYLAIGSLIIIALVILYIISRNKVSLKWIDFSAFVAVLLIFQFLETLLHPYISKYTHGYPIYFMCINIVLAASIKPLHHFIEKRVATISRSMNKKAAKRKSKKMPANEGNIK